MDPHIGIRRVWLCRDPVLGLVIKLLHRGQELAALGAETQRVRIGLVFQQLVADQLIVAEAGAVLFAPLLQLVPILALAVLADGGDSVAGGVDGDVAWRVICGANDVLPDVVEAVDEMLRGIALLDTFPVLEIRSVERFLARELVGNLSGQFEMGLEVTKQCRLCIEVIMYTLCVWSHGKSADGGRPFSLAYSLVRATLM
jgi:hypothetical protein